jgi:peroxiredoxin Q/BCP
VGETAPLFVGQTHDGAAFDLKQRRGHFTVLYFYPKDGTPGCTKQACAFRDALQGLEGLDAKVYGISRVSC